MWGIYTIFFHLLSIFYHQICVPVYQYRLYTLLQVDIIHYVVIINSIIEFGYFRQCLPRKRSEFPLTLQLSSFSLDIDVSACQYSNEKEAGCWVTQEIQTTCTWELHVYAVF